MNLNMLLEIVFQAGRESTEHFPLGTGTMSANEVWNQKYSAAKEYFTSEKFKGDFAKFAGIDRKW